MPIQERTILSAIRVGIYTTLFLPFIVVPQLLFFPFPTSKGFLFQIIVEIIFALYLALALKNPAYRPKKTLLFYAVSFYFLALLLSTIFGLDPYHSFFGNYERMWGFFQLSHFFLFFVILVGVFKSREEWARLLKTALLAGALTVGFSLFQVVGSLIYNNSIPRVSGIIGNPAFLAGYLFFPFLFSLLFLRRSHLRSYEGVTFGALTLFSLFSILSTATRGAFIGLGAALVAAMSLILLSFPPASPELQRGERKPVCVPRTGRRESSLKIIAVVFLLSMVIGAGALLKYGALFQKPEKISQEQYYNIDRLDASVEQSGSVFGSLSRLTKFSLYDTTTQTRLIAWRASLGALKNFSFFGIGPENFNLAFNKYFNPDFYTYARGESWFDRAHNIYIDVLVTTGFIGFAAYLFIFIACFYTVFRLYRAQKINPVRSLREALYPVFTFQKKTSISVVEATEYSASNGINLIHIFVFSLFFVAYAAQNVFLFDSFAPFLMFIFAIAFLNSFAVDPRRPGPPNGKALPSFSRISSGFLASFLLLAVIIYFFNIKPILENYYIAQAESGEYGIDQAVKYYKQALTYNTFGDNEARSRMALAVARAVQAEESEHLPPNLSEYLDYTIAGLKQNIKESSDYYLLYRLQLADLYNLKLSRTALASPEIEDIMKKSIAISPGRMEFEFALAQTEFLKGNFQEAIRILTEASKKNPDHPMPYWKISQNYHFMGDDDKAIPFLEEAFYRGQGVRNPKEIMWSEQYYVKKENYPKIIFIDKLLLNQSPDQKESVRLHINLAVAYAKLEQKDKAIGHAKEVEKIDPAQKETVDIFLRELQ